MLISEKNMIKVLVEANVMTVNCCWLHTKVRQRTPIHPTTYLKINFQVAGLQGLAKALILKS